MDLRTTIKATRHGIIITYYDPVMFIGSCFAGSIGQKFEEGRMPVMINPSGTVYNPVSVCNTLDSITSGKKYKQSDLYNHGGKWLSFNHYTDFSSDNPDEVIGRINRINGEAGNFISRARFLFVTFGTARIYRWKRSGRVVSNCHKIPASEFTHELLSVGAVVSLWKDQLDRLYSLFPDLKVVFTISPVRHWKDGAHGNQISKSVLFLAVEELTEHPSKPTYFPAYEIVMDDLRDYRFYDEDMLHPSQAAIEYIWSNFTDSYFDKKTLDTWKEISSITRAVSHRIRSASRDEIIRFASNMLARIDAVVKNMPGVNLSCEKAYFRKLQDL